MNPSHSGTHSKRGGRAPVPLPCSSQGGARGDHRQKFSNALRTDLPHTDFLAPPPPLEKSCIRA